MTAVTTIEIPLDQDTLREKCRILKDEGLSFTAQAKECGIAYGSFTNWLGGTYGGPTDKIAEKVSNWLDARTERAAAVSALPTAPSYVATPTSTAIMTLFTFAQSSPDIVVVAAGAGVGKTTTAQEYKRTRPNVYVITMRPTTSGTHTMLAEIAEVMAIEERSANKLSRAIGRKVQGSNALLIIDEAQHLQSSALDELRSLYDAWGVGIALVGNQTVYTRLEGQGRQSSLAQLFSRVGMRLTQAKPRTEDVATLVAAWGIRDPKMLKTLQSIASKPGALRGVTKTLRLATMVASGDGQDGAATALTDAHLRGSWKQLGDTLVD